jgi:hypothetical protein
MLRIMVLRSRRKKREMTQRIREWEYKVIDLIEDIRKQGVNEIETSARWIYGSDLEETLNRLGTQGWELINVHFLLENEALVVGVFKRPR